MSFSIFSYQNVIYRIEELYSLLIEYIIEILQRQDRITLIADGWTDKRGRRYMGLASRYIENSTINHIFLGLLNLPEIFHSSANIAINIQECLNMYKVEMLRSATLGVRFAPP